ncbi:MAG: clostripain-related cysteine peptidase, partial [candidate division WOR-3 bacterium]
MRIFLLSLIFPLFLSAREWTVLVYMAADNSLSALADSDLIEMKAVGSNDNLAILVQVDKPYTGANRYYVGEDTLYNLGNLGIIDMCDWHTLRDFLEWGVMLLPAKRYFLILWDHGTGWTLAPRRTFGSDGSAGTQLSIANGDLNRALKGFYEATGKKFNIIGFDACNMQQIEIANEIKDYAKVCIAPQTVWPVNGFPYENIFYIFRTEPGINEIDLGKKIAEICKAYYSNQPSALSLIDLENLDNLKKSLKKNINNIMLNSPTQSLKDLRNYVQTVSLMDPNPVPEDDYIDLGDFLKLLNDYLSTKETRELLESYNKTVLKSESWGANLIKLTGITTWFPDRYIEFKNLVELYILLSYNDTGWANFLNWFYGQDDIRPTNAQLFMGGAGKNNDFHLFWTKSFDLAPVVYDIIECADTILLFGNNCEDSTNWLFNGFSIATNIAYDGNASFFSGNSSNLNNSLLTKENFEITVKTFSKDKSHVVKRLSVMLKVFGIMVKDKELKPVVYTDNKIISELESISKFKKEILISMNISAGHISRYWQIDKWIKLINEILKLSARIKIWLLSAPRDKKIRKYIINRINNSRAIEFNKDNLHYFLSAIAISDLLISPDTSAIHAACAFGAPVIGL